MSLHYRKSVPCGAFRCKSGRNSAKVVILVTGDQGLGTGSSGLGITAWDSGILVSQPSPLGKAVKLSGRTFLAPRRGCASELDF